MNRFFTETVKKKNAIIVFVTGVFIAVIGQLINISEEAQFQLSVCSN